jgi:hypothetical protein
VAAYPYSLGGAESLTWLRQRHIARATMTNTPDGTITTIETITKLLAVDSSRSS